MPFLAIATEDRSWGTWIEPYHAKCTQVQIPTGRLPAFGFDIVRVRLSNHVAGRLPIMTTRNPHEKLDLDSRKLNQVSSMARRIYQLSVSSCVNQMSDPTKCLVCRDYR